MASPAILVVDETFSPPLTTHYLKGDNEIELDAIYHGLHVLLRHPGRGHLTHHPEEQEEAQQVRLHPCTSVFLSDFWKLSANFFDYFADFLRHDSIEMQCLWFGLLDMLQSITKLPHTHWTNDIPSCTHSRDFGGNWDKYIDTLNKVILARKKVGWECEELMHGKEGLIVEPDFSCGGPWKAGKTPWQQYLERQSPGFGVARADRVWYNHAGGGEEVVSESGEMKIEDEPGKVILAERFLPMGALAIMQRYLERGRELAVRTANETEGLSEAEFLREYDANSPSLTNPQTYPLLSSPSVKLFAQPFHTSSSSAATPRRLDGLFDPALLMPVSSMWLIDEAVGNYKGVESVEHPLGTEEFQMLRVVSFKNAGRDGDEIGPTGKERTALEKEMEELMGDMFDEWEVSD